MNRNKHILVGAAAIAVLFLLAASICRYPHPANAERNEPYAEQPVNAERNEPYAEQPTVCGDDPADSFELPHHDDSSEQVIYHAAYTVGYNPTYTFRIGWRIAWRVMKWMATSLVRIRSCQTRS